MSVDLEAEIAEWKKLTGDVGKLEAALEATKSKRGAIVARLFEAYGKGHIYDLGTGVPMIISMTKAKTYFFVAKDRWKNGEGKPRVKKEKVEGSEKPKKEKGTKKAKGSSSDEEKAKFQAALEAAKTAPVVAPVTAMEHTMVRGHVTPENPLANQAPVAEALHAPAEMPVANPVPQSPIPVVEEEDPLMAALAEAAAASE